MSHTDFATQDQDNTYIQHTEIETRRLLFGKKHFHTNLGNWKGLNQQ